jgi:hypothetical protein
VGDEVEERKDNKEKRREGRVEKRRVISRARNGLENK